MDRGEAAKSLDYRRQALAVFAATLPPEHALLLYQRAELAETLVALNEADAARDELIQIVGLAEHSPGVHMWLTYWQTQLAQASYNSGRYEEGLARYATVVEQTISEHGAEHATTLERRFALAELQIDAGQLADAAKTIAALELAHGKRTDPSSAQQLARVRGELGARLALARGRTQKAADAARLALAALSETGAPESERAGTEIVLGTSYVEQGKYLEARRLLEHALDVLRADHANEGALAIAEIALARAEYGLGLRDVARARGEHARDVLARYRGHQRPRREVAAFLATTARDRR